MDFQTFCRKLEPNQCPRWNSRQKRLHALDLIRRAKHYYELDLQDFDDMRGSDWKPFGHGEGYVPLKNRRPAGEYRLPAIITRDTVAMMFSESTFPTIVFEEEADTDGAQLIISKGRLRSVMFDAATEGGSGSTCIVVEAFAGDTKGNHNLFVDTWPAYECDPVFKRNNPGLLESITRTWKVSRDSLKADGYDLDALELVWKKYIIEKKLEKEYNYEADKRLFEDWYIRRELTADASVWYIPTPLKIYHKKHWDDWIKDGERSTTHGLKFVNAIWITNLTEDVLPDGICTFEGAINNQFVIDRVLSTGQQAIVTAGSPVLAISKPNGDKTFGADGGNSPGGQSMEVSPDSILEVEESGGAWLVQMSAESTMALDTYVRLLRGLSIENCAGSRISEDGVSGKESGYAMELLNQSLVWLAGHLRHSYGEPGLVALVRMIARVHAKYPITTLLKAKFDPDAELKEISWGPYYEPSGQDKLAEVQAAIAAIEGGLIDTETAIANIGPYYDVIDVQGMAEKAKAEQQERADAEQANAVALIQAKPQPKPGAK